MSWMKSIVMLIAALQLSLQFAAVQAYWDDGCEDGMTSVQDMENARHQAEMRQGTLLQISKPAKGRAVPTKTVVYEEENPLPGAALATDEARRGRSMKRR
mmetsp:Transcript_40892/g.73908  ORF Transcript_40892/g.73908 Transcript_40892/m.73908 type:complete len:100 (+) Transcript_40892:130-429(+)